MGEGGRVSNFKRMVRERMSKTGESWQTAQRYVRAQADKKRQRPRSLAEQMAVEEKRLEEELT